MPKDNDYKCAMCGYIHVAEKNPSKGPSDWVCPECGADYECFELQPNIWGE